jgi:hypothetical protein
MLRCYGAGTCVYADLDRAGPSTWPDAFSDFMRLLRE